MPEPVGPLISTGPGSRRGCPTRGRMRRTSTGVVPARSSSTTAATTVAATMRSRAVAGTRGSTRTCTARRCGMPRRGSGQRRSPDAIQCAAPSLTSGRAGALRRDDPRPEPGRRGVAFNRAVLGRRIRRDGVLAQSRAVPVASSGSPRPACPWPGRRARCPTSTSRALMRPSARSRRTEAQCRCSESGRCSARCAQSRTGRQRGRSNGPECPDHASRTGALTGR